VILETLQSDLVQTLKDKDTFKMGLLRYLLAMMKNREIELRPAGKEMNDEEAFRVIKKQIKQRNDSIESYKLGKRDDLVKKETDELNTLQTYFNKWAELFPNVVNPPRGPVQKQ
jgi:hypothetical protein